MFHIKYTNIYDRFLILMDLPWYKLEAFTSL